MGISLEISLEHCRGQLKGSDETRHSWGFVFRAIVKSQEVELPAVASGASDFWEAMEDEEGDGGPVDVAVLVEQERERAEKDRAVMEWWHESQHALALEDVRR